MKNIKRITKILKWLQIGVAIVLTLMMMKAMRMLYMFLKEGGSF